MIRRRWLINRWTANLFDLCQRTPSIALVVFQTHVRWCDLLSRPGEGRELIYMIGRILSRMKGMSLEILATVFLLTALLVAWSI